MIGRSWLNLVVIGGAWEMWDHEKTITTTIIRLALLAFPNSNLHCLLDGDFPDPCNERVEVGNCVWMWFESLSRAKPPFAH